MLSIIISVAALIVSCVALWKTHFAGFSPTARAGDLRHRIYPIRSEGQRWFISSFDVPFTIANQGARPGLITGLRLRLHYPNLPIPGNHELLPAKFELHPDKATSIGKDRFEWIGQIVAAHWAPYVILPKQTVSKHVVLEARWDEPVIQDDIQATLEMHVEGSPHWWPISKWRLNLTAREWSELADVGTSISYPPDGSAQPDESVSPPDLHKYTGTKQSLPTDGFGAKPSYLDYPQKPKS